MITAPRSPQYAFSVPIMSWKFTRRRLRIGLDGNSPLMEKEVCVARVDAYKTKSGNTRFVLREDEGNEYTTFREAIARQAVAAEGRRARIEFHEQQRNGFTNVYLDGVEPLEEDDGEHRDADEAAWEVAVEAAPWLPAFFGFVAFFFGSIFLTGLPNLFQRGGTTLLTIGYQGLEIPRSGLIPWTEIEEVGQTHVAGQRAIGIWTTDPYFAARHG